MLSYKLPSNVLSQSLSSLHIEEGIEVLTDLKQNYPVEFFVMMQMESKSLLCSMVASNLILCSMAVEHLKCGEDTRGNEF